MSNTVSIGRPLSVCPENVALCEHFNQSPSSTNSTFDFDEVGLECAHATVKNKNKLQTIWTFIKWYMRLIFNALFGFTLNKIITFDNDDENDNGDNDNAAVVVDIDNDVSHLCEHLNLIIDSHSHVALIQECNFNESVDCIADSTETLHLALVVEHDWAAIANVIEVDQPVELIRCLSVEQSVEYQSLPNLESTYPVNITKLDCYQLDLLNGTLNVQNHNQHVQELFNSIIPRNLSNTDTIDEFDLSKKPKVHLNQSAVYQTSIMNDQLTNCLDKLDIGDSSDCLLGVDTVNRQMSTNTVDQAPNYCSSISNENFYLDNSPPTSMSPPQTPISQTLAAALSGQNKDELVDSRRSRFNDSLRNFSPRNSMLFDKITLPTDMPKPKRSSSLKSSRSPPDTPIAKAVRFADVLGLDLTSVRHVFDFETPPKIPASAIVHLNLESDESIAKIGSKHFRIGFAQPCASSNFIQRVHLNIVCLEEVLIEAQRGMLTGSMRVKSLGFEKHIFVRLTCNNWITFSDYNASYVQNSHDNGTDRFSFSIVLPDTLGPGDKAQFAVCYKTPNGEQFWDSNQGRNYLVYCYAKATDLAGDGSWLHYL